MKSMKSLVREADENKTLGEENHLSSQKYKEEELLDSIVVDKEGYICGYINDVSVEPNNIIIHLYAYDVKKEEIPDEEELTKQLLTTVPRKGILHHEPSIEEFYDYVRETLNLSNREPVTLEHFVKYATTKKIVVPKKTQEFRVKKDKGSINWPSVEKIAFTDLGKCVLLKETVEAEKRGVAIREKVDYRDTEDILGKLVVDSDAKIVGSVAKFLIGSPPGLLIHLERVAREQTPNIESLKKSLIPSRFEDSRQLSDRVKKDLHLEENVNDINLIIWATRNGISVQDSVVETREVVMELPVSWDKILRIGDVVVLKEPIDALSRYY